MNRIPSIFSAPTPAEVVAEIDRLHDLYKSLFHKNLGAELFYSQWGERRDNHHEISLYWEDEFAGDAAWVRENVRNRE